MASMRKIAQQANVSVATVSRALSNSSEVNPATRMRVLKAVNEVKYFCAIGKRVTTNIGLILAIPNEFSSFEALLMAGITRGLGEQKFDITIINLERDKKDGETYTQFFMRKGVRGVIVHGLTSARHVCQAIANEGFPMVAVAERFEAPKINYIGYYSGDESRRAVEHLLQLGHKRIALGMHRVPDLDHADRLEGYKQALASANVEFDPDLVVPLIAHFQGGVSAINHLLSMRVPPTAVYFTDPLSTVGAIQRAHSICLRIPEDISIIGFDDGEMRYQVYPTLTAVCQNVSDLGLEAALWLTRKLNGISDEPLRKTISAFLEVNGSTSVPPENPIRILPDGTRVPVTP